MCNSNEKPGCKLIGEDGNIYNLCAIASSTLKSNNMYADADEMWKRVQKSGSYEEALMIISDYVNIY